MTLGQKLSAYRKLAGITQQQLGDKLNISAQAVSKWENDQAEPDLATVRALAGIYKTTVDTLLDLDASPVFTPDDIDAEEKENEKPEIILPIGSCKDCGISVTKETIGARTPVILCRKCTTARKLAEEKAAAKRKQEALEKEQKEKFERAQNIAACKRRFIWSTSVASGITLLFVIFMIKLMTASFNTTILFATIVGAYAIFAFVNCLFYDTIVSDVVIDWATKSFQFPGLIFTLDLDGCMWLIGMKLLFWALGLLFSIAATSIGVVIGLVCASFIYPFTMIRLKADCNKGIRSELLDT